MTIIYRAAVAGCGKGGGIHTNAYRKHPRFELVAICDVRPEALEKRAEGQPGLRRYDDYREMLAKEKIDFLSVATLPPTHADIALAGVEAGVKAILCEKPVAHDVASARRIVEGCRKAGVALAVTHQARYSPAGRKLRERYQAGQIGDALTCEMRMPGYDMSSSAVHMINQMAFILGDVSAAHVTAQMDCSTRKIHDGMQVETAGVALYVLQNGARCLVETGDIPVPSARPNGMRIFGTKGRFEFDLWGNKFALWNSEHPQGLLCEPQPAPGDAAAPGGGHVMMAGELIEQIETGKLDYTNPEQGLAALEIVCAAYLSASRRERIFLPVADDLALDRERDWAGMPLL